MSSVEYQKKTKTKTKVVLGQGFLRVLRFAPFQYRSSIAPFQFINLSPTLYTLTI